jgi:hypothetical protein
MNEDVKKDAIPPVQDGLQNKLFNFIIEEYMPCTNGADATVELMTTREIYEKMQALHPGSYSIAEVSSFLHNNGFTFINSGKFTLEWLLKRNTK